MKFNMKRYKKFLQLQRRWQSSEINSQDETDTVIAITDITTTGTPTTIINNDNNILLQELFCEACSILYNDILNAIDHQMVC